MSTYKEIKGFKVQTLSSDPVASGVAGGSWSSGGSLNVGKYWNGRSGAGTQTAGLIAGGHNGSGQVGTTESYNGSSWTEVNDLNTARNSATMGGAQTSALITGGGTAEAITESWNGSSWTEVADLNTGRRQLAMATGNANTSALAFGGYAPPTPGPVGYTGLTESWNGSSWTEVNDLNTPRSSLGSTDGSATAALAIAGYRGPPTADRTKFVEQWNGSSWTEVGDVNQERMDLASCGTTTNALAFGGFDTASLAVTENYNGTSWTELADLATARYALGGTGSTPAALAIGGYITTVQSVTEEWNIATDFTKQNLGQVYYNSTTNTFKVTKTVFGTGAWASGGNMPLARDSHAGFGTQTATGAVGGRTTPGPSPALTTSVNTFVEYDGSSWTSGPTINQQRWLGEASGTLTSAILYTGGNPGSNNTITNVEIWNGSGWTETTDINTARRSLGGAGISSTAALAYGGRDTGGSSTPPVAITESWNGSSWTEVADLNTARAYNTGSGTTTSAIYAGGHDGTASSAKSEVYDGTSWTETANLNTARHSLANSGNSTDALAFAGRSTPPGINRALTESFDGTSWTEVADLATARYDLNSGGSPGSSGSAIATGGYGTAYSNAAEEWNVPATVTNTTITVS